MSLEPERRGTSETSQTKPEYHPQPGVETKSLVKPKKAVEISKKNRKKKYQHSSEEEGQDREFPATRHGRTKRQLTQEKYPSSSSTTQLIPISLSGGSEDGEDSISDFDVSNMGGGDSDRYYARCTSAGNPLNPGRDYHYGQDGHHYRSSSSTARGRSQGASTGEMGAYHSPHVNSGSGRSRRTAAVNDYYVDGGKTSSPYHHSSSSRRTANERQQQQQDANNYMLLRQAQRHQQAAALAAAAAAEYEHRIQHHSGSRSDLLEHDHNAIYEMSSSPYSAGPAAAAGNQYSFVRTCDGKFVRTAIPMHEFDALVESAAAASASGATTNGSYYRNSVNHTLRRPSKRHSQAVASDAYSCCPPREDLLMNNDRSGGGTGSRNNSMTQSYATLRGRKWTEKQRAGCTAQGIGDNYGRTGATPGTGSHLSASYMDQDSRSVASFTDDFLALPPPGRDGHFQQPLPPMGMGLAPGSSTRIMSRSTDRNLDNIGLDDDGSLLLTTSGIPVRASDMDMLSLLTREPPDGKEKPEPAGKSHKLESTAGNTLSRKSSKCDLFSSSNSTSGIGTGSSGSGSTAIQQGDSRSEATSMCGDTASVLSGSTVNGSGANGHIPISKTDSSSSSVATAATTAAAAAAAASATAAKRDSLSGAKDQIAMQSYNGADVQDDLDSGLSSVTSNKDW